MAFDPAIVESAYRHMMSLPASERKKYFASLGPSMQQDLQGMIRQKGAADQSVVNNYSHLDHSIDATHKVLGDPNGANSGESLYGNNYGALFNRLRDTKTSAMRPSMAQQLGQATGRIFANFLGSRIKSPTSSYTEDNARLADIQAAKNDQMAQQHARVANQDYKQRAEQMTASSANAAARRAGATGAGYAGGAAATVAAQQNAIEQADYDTQQQVGLSQQQLANQRSDNANVLRQQANTRRTEAVQDNMQFADTQRHNAEQHELSMGRAPGVTDTTEDTTDNNPDIQTTSDGKKWIYDGNTWTLYTEEA